MRFTNPIIVKELIQTSHRRRTFVFRAVLPGIAIIILAWWVGNTLAEVGSDWKSLKDVTRPIFYVTVWMLMVVLPILGGGMASASIQREWTGKTMEILCAAPISWAGIVWGKFVGVMGKVLVLGLGLLPIMGVWIRMGRLPTGLALASLGVVFGGTLMFAALAMLRASAFPGRRSRDASGVDVALVFCLVPWLLSVAEVVDHPVIPALVPYWSLALVTTDAGPGLMSAETFRWWAVAVPIGVSLVALALCPSAFRWRFTRRLGGSKAGGEQGGRRRWLRGRRPPLKPQGDPFRWQEIGPPTRLLRWGVWIGYGVVLAVTLALIVAGENPTVFNEPGFYFALLTAGTIMLALVCLVYGVRVFASEKARNTAESLILTGVTPARLMGSKLLAMYRSVAVPMLSLMILLGVALSFAEMETLEPEAVAGAAGYCLGVLMGPALAALVGMAFSVTARSPSRAMAGVLVAVAMFVGLGICASIIMGLMATLMAFGAGDSADVMIAGLGVMVFMAMVLVTILCATVRRWNPWIMALVLALVTGIQVGIGSVGSAIYLRLTDFNPIFGSGRDELVFVCFMVSLGMTVGLASIAFWYFMTRRIFESGMLAQPLARPTPRPPAVSPAAP